MLVVFRQKVIRTLIDEISLLSGGKFEQFCYKIMEVVYPAQWVERGTTVEGAPRKCTIDTSTEGSMKVAEMSSDIDYFHGPMSKPKNDLNHAIMLHPDVKRIWLLSSREAEAGETTRCANVATQFLKEHETLISVEILDARQIAGYIFDNLEAERFVSALTSYLPSLGRLTDENAFSHRIPIYSGYQARPDKEQEVITKIANASCIVVNGISGVGKSALVARVAEILRPDFEIIIWYDAHDLKNVTELSDSDFRRTGIRHNIIGLLHRYKCLLILDDATLSREQISKIDCGESKVIITCQASSDPDRIMVEDLDYDSARRLLEAGVSMPCPSEIFQRVFSAIGGYPLLLDALNRVAKDEGWEAVAVCCEDAASSIEDERNNKVCQRILMRHLESLSVELEFVKWCGCSRFDSELTAVCASTRAVNNLQKRAFLAATMAGSIRIHDVVYQSICSLVEVSAQHDKTFRDKLDEFICTECDKERSVLHRMVNLHPTLFRRLLSSGAYPSFIYAVALARASDTPIDLFGDPVATAKIVAAYNVWSGCEIEVRAIIETVEALYTIISSKCGSDEAKTTLGKNIVALEILRSSPAAKGELLRDLKHHFAKMLVRLGKRSDAETEFRVILAEYPMFAAGRLQLARILYESGRKLEALAESRQIIIQHRNKQFLVSAPVLLEALRLVFMLDSQDNLRSYEEVVMSSLAEAREFDRTLALRLIATVAQKTWFTMPDLVTRMFESIEWRDAAPITDSERSDWAQAHKLAAKATDVGDSRRKDFLIAADETYKSIKTPNSYHIVQHAEVLILLEKFDEANILLDQVSGSTREAFWWQRKSQAALGMHQADIALEAINHGIQNLTNKIYLSAFLHDRYLARKFLGDPEAKKDLQEAINKLPDDDKYRKSLESEYMALT